MGKRDSKKRQQKETAKRDSKNITSVQTNNGKKIIKVNE
jgi:hypothetical protein